MLVTAASQRECVEKVREIDPFPVEIGESYGAELVAIIRDASPIVDAAL